MENDYDLLDWQTSTNEGSQGMLGRNEAFIIWRVIFQLVLVGRQEKNSKGKHQIGGELEERGCQGRQWKCLFMFLKLKAIYSHPQIRRK